MSDEPGNVETASAPAPPLSHSPAPPASQSSLALKDVLLLLALSLAILLPGIQASLIDRDEGWYAQVSREMVESGDWLIPRYLGEPWIAKPPLLYWLVSASYAAFGVGEWQARLVPVCASLVNVLLVGALGARLFGRRAGLLAGIILITAGLPAIVGKMLLTDAVLLTTILAAVTLHWSMVGHGAGHLRCAAYWGCIGIGVLAKGPAVLVFAGAFGLALLIVRERTWIRTWRWWVWLPLALFIAAPWYIYVAIHEKGTLVEQFVWYEIGARIAGSPHGHGGPPGYYILLSIAGLLPWTVFVPGTLIIAAKSRPREARVVTLLLWLAIPWVILELVRSKLPHYIVPCYVPLALLLARELDGAMRAARPWKTLSRGEQRALELWTLPLMVTGASAIVLAFRYCGRWAVAAALCGLVLLVGFACVRQALRRAGLARAFAVSVVTVAGLHLVAGALLLPALEPLRVSRRVAEAINSHATHGEQVYVVDFAEPSTFFYLKGAGRPLSVSEVSALPSDGSGAVVALTDDALKELGAAQPHVRLLGGVSGFNYVKMQEVSVWIARVGGPATTEASE